MSTALNLEPPSITKESSLDELLAPGCDVYVELCGKLYPGKVSRGVYSAIGEVSIETTAARQMSKQWKVLLFYSESRRAVYGLATLVIPSIDPYDASTIVPEYEKKKPGEEFAQLDQPEAIAREEDVEAWEQPTTLEPEEARELWYQREN